MRDRMRQDETMLVIILRNILYERTDETGWDNVDDYSPEYLIWEDGRNRMRQCWWLFSGIFYMRGRTRQDETSFGSLDVNSCVCRRIFMKLPLLYALWHISRMRFLKTVWQKRKLLITSIFFLTPLSNKYFIYRSFPIFCRYNDHFLLYALCYNVFNFKLNFSVIDLFLIFCRYIFKFFCCRIVLFEKLLS